MLAIPLFAFGCNQVSVNKKTPEPIIQNPYDEGSGHYAGYNWAQENGGDCSASSDSFNEGCEAYYNQLNRHSEWVKNN